MPPVDKARAAGVSASSFFDLKAELSKQEAEFSKNKVAGKSSYSVGGVKRPDKKPTIWARPNKGVKARASRDLEQEELSKPTLESARAALERKAKIYDKLKKGKTAGLNDRQYDELLVDFDSKPVSDTWESDSDDVDESAAPAKAPEEWEDDPIIEYEDEFGRTVTARRSEVPRHLMPRDSNNVDVIPDHDEDVIYNPVNYFPTYEPSEERIAAVEKEYAEGNNPLSGHYDASREVRAKGAGFYQFSADEELRYRQMEELRAAREETLRTREETGAVDTRAGDAELFGMRGDTGDGGGGGGAVDAEGAVGKSRAMEKRKRELEERRKMLDAKRKKAKVTIDGGESSSTSSTQAGLDQRAATSITVSSKGKTTDTGKVNKRIPSSSSGALDPFAALEANGGKTNTTVDDFFADLEQRISEKTR